MAPRPLAHLSKNGIPSHAVLLSIAGCWLVILLYAFDPDSAFYTYLLSVSGLTGALAWISICWSQYRSRRTHIAAGTEDSLRYKTPLFPYITLFGIWSQVICLVVMLFDEELRVAFYAGVPMLLIPMLLYRLRAWRLKAAALGANILR